MSEKKNLIAVYGTLRQGCGNYEHFLEDADYKGTFDSEPIYSLYSLGGFPGLKTDGQTSVKMEVYGVDDMTAKAVDALEGYNPNRVPHFYDKQSIETPWGTAGVYIYVRDIAARELIVNGDWKERTFKPVKDGVN